MSVPVSPPYRGCDDAIVATGLRKRFGATEALRDIDLAVPRGTVFGLLGPNGAGKSTTVRILTTLLRPDAGGARVGGYDVVRQAEHVRCQIGLAGQYATVDELLTGRANLEMIGRLYHLPPRLARRRAEELLERFGLTEAAGRIVKTYSGGMRRRLDLAASLVATPPILFLDEPTTGLDPASRQAVWDLVADLTADGATVLLTTQYLEEADRLAGRIAVIDHGRVIANDTPEALKSRIGTERIDVVVPDDASIAAAVRALTRATGSVPSVDQRARRLTAPVTGRGALTRVVRELDADGIAFDDVAIHRPTLDDVFLHLTGRTAGDDAANTAAGKEAA